MVLNQNNNLMYPCQIIAAGSDLKKVRNAKPRIMQAGIRASKETYSPLDAYLAGKGFLQAGQQQQEPTEQQMFETFQAFSNNKEYYDLPNRHINVMSAGIKQASVIRKPTSDIEILQTFMEFGGLS